MPLLMDGGDGQPLTYTATCRSCGAKGPSAAWEMAKTWPADAAAAVAAEARLIGWSEIKPGPRDGHFIDWLCRKCTGGLL